MRTSVLEEHDDNATRCSLGNDLSSEDRVVDLDPHTVGVLLAHRLRQDVLRA